MQVSTYMRKTLNMAISIYINCTLKRPLKTTPSHSPKKNIGDNMDMKKIFFALVVSTLLIGSACAASVNDFKVDDTYKSVYIGEYYSVYADNNQDSGIIIFKNVDDDVYDDMENDDVLDNVIHHDGREYITADDDLKLDVNSDNTANFTDYDHATHGISEVVGSNGEQYIVTVWAKDSSNMDNAKLLSTLNEFNKNNDVKAVAF